MSLMHSGEDFMNHWEAEFGPPGDFVPNATYIEDGDCIEFFARPGGYYAERLDDLVTVYRSRKDNEIVGSLIKGVTKLCKDVLSKYPGFKIEVHEGRVRLSHLFRAHLWSEPANENDIRVKTYELLIEAAEETKAEARLCSA